MTVTWPGSPDTLAKPGALTKTNDSGFFLDEVIADHATLLERMESGIWLPLVINGNMDHWQQGDGAAVIATTTYNTITSYNADQMFVLPAGASVTTQRS